MATRWGWTITAVLGLLMTGALAGAQGAGSGTGVGPGFAARRPPMERAFRFSGAHGQWWNNPKIAERLKLTDEQRKAMDQILHQHREKLIDLQANLEKANLAMPPLMNADAPNQAAIEAQIDKVVQARGDLERANARFLLAIRMKLTPEQWKQVQDFRNERGAGRMGPGRGRRWMQRQQPGPGPAGNPPPPPATGGTGVPQ
ncbi:MAG: periplasmic heavy metal sensor [Acidobacteriota bacterium]|nr:periplasmic heavy metal sensor [Acidobacteriota bacterium]